MTKKLYTTVLPLIKCISVRKVGEIHTLTLTVEGKDATLHHFSAEEWAELKALLYGS